MIQLKGQLGFFDDADLQVAGTLRSISGTKSPSTIDTPGLAAMEICWDGIGDACRGGIGAEHLFVAGVDLGVRLAKYAMMPADRRQGAFRQSIEACLEDLRAYGRVDG